MVRKRYSARNHSQLALGISTLQDHFDGVVLHFRLLNKPVSGILKGSSCDWFFESGSPAFTRLIPGGRLSKYMLWNDAVPNSISDIYNGILESAWKEGYDLGEREV
ncbi:MAG TPA: hypothetical protein VHK91_04190 [Flavisolibacter sp.]|jgi:hypothetical protein|nr:hypothetical protein [Flavisolibacter sp.]